MIEKYIKGGEYTSFILNGEVFPTISIKANSEFFDFESKYSLNGATEEVVYLEKELQEKEEEELLKWKRPFLPPLLKEDSLDYIEVSLFDLAESFFVLMKKKEREGIKTIKGKEYSLEEKMKEILVLLEAREFLDFLDYFSQAESFEEALVSFLGLLELIKARIVVALQESHFQPIKVWLRRKERLTSN